MPGSGKDCLQDRRLHFRRRDGPVDDKSRCRHGIRAGTEARRDSRVRRRGELANYDCHANSSFAFLHPVAPLYSTLLKFDAANYPNIEGNVAETWQVSADGRVYTFKLRPNVLFHDGSHLTSADVKASYDRSVSEDLVAAC
jgi:ABC-type transport system substrate-binding protein